MKKLSKFIFEELNVIQILKATALLLQLGMLILIYLAVR